MSADAGLVPVVLTTLRQAGWWAERLQSGRIGRVHLARAGSPDVVAVRPAGPAPEPWLIECKRPSGKLRQSQSALQGWCARHGVRYAVVRSVADLAAIVERRRA